MTQDVHDGFIVKFVLEVEPLVLGELVSVKLSGYVKNPGIVEIRSGHGGGGRMIEELKANDLDLYGARVHTSVNKYKTMDKHGPTH